MNRAIVLSKAATGWLCSKNLTDKNRSQAPENIEVVPLDDVSDRRGDDHPPEVLRNCSHVVLPLFHLLYRFVERGSMNASVIANTRRNLLGPTTLF